MPKRECPICEAEAAGWPDGHMSCRRCGEFYITLEFFRDFGGNADARKIARFLSAATRQAHEAGRPITLTAENWRDLSAVHESVSVSRKVEKVLRYFAAKCGHPGVLLTALDSGVDYPIADCHSPAELEQYVTYLEEKKLLQAYRDQEVNEDDKMCGYSPTIDGWQAIEPSLLQGGTPGTCFVAMWFDPSMNEAYDLGILPAVELDCGFKALRVDRKEHNNQITDEIMAGIRSAEFTVADFTGDRGGVYYEAGFARGLGRTVIHCCKESDMGKIHFDTKIISHVTWSHPAELRKKLADRIRWTILPKA